MVALAHAKSLMTSFVTDRTASHQTHAPLDELEDSFLCTRASTSSSDPDSCTERCGNQALDPNGAHTESCDDGNVASGDGCDS